ELNLSSNGQGNHRISDGTHNPSSTLARHRLDHHRSVATPAGRQSGLPIVLKGPRARQTGEPMATAVLDAMREYDLTEEDFRFLARQVYDLTGIVIHERKREMLYSRLSSRLRSLNLSNFRRYCDYIGGPDGGAEIGAMINAVTTNLTYFFRESHHFEHLRDVALP